MPTDPRASALPASRAHVVSRPEYEGFFGLLLLAILLVTTIDDGGMAQLGRGLVLASFALLTVINAGAATGVYVGAAIIFSVHHYSGQGSWVQRPDNYMLLMLAGYLALARSFSRGSRTVDRTFFAMVGLVMFTVLRLAMIGQLGAHTFSWFVRMFGAAFALFILLRGARLTHRELRAMFLITAGIGGYLALMSVFEAFGWYGLLVPAWVADPEFNWFHGLERVGGLLMQPEWNALVISLALCVLLMRLDRARSAGTMAWMGAALLCLMAIYFTYTRAAWLGLLVAGAPAFWTASGRHGVTVRRRAIFLGFVLLFASVTLLFPSDMTRARMSDTGTVVYRLHIWAAGAAMVADYPLLGVGFGQFIERMGDYGQVAELPQVADPEGIADLAHNTPLSVAAELGLIGLGLYLMLLYGVFRSALGAAESGRAPVGKLWMAAFIIIYLVNTQFITAHELVPNILFFSILGAVAGCAGAVASQASLPAGEQGNVPRRRSVA